MPKVFTGLRSGKVSGEEDFIKFLKEEELGQYIKSVKADNWFYIGTWVMYGRDIRENIEKLDILKEHCIGIFSLETLPIVRAT